MKRDLTKNTVIAGFLAMPVLSAATEVAAQNAGWEYRASVYLFAPESTTTIGTPAGPIESVLPFSDALENLDFAFMGAFEASNGQWSVIGDYMLNDLSFSGETPNIGASSANTSVKIQLFSGYLTYRAFEDATTTVDVGGGFRWFDTDTTITLVGTPPPAPSATVGDDWVDPLLALRARFRLGDRWIGTLLADYGGFSSDRETWQILLTAGYEINENWLLQGGYRHIEVDNQEAGTSFNFQQSGPVFGVTYRF